MADLRKRSDSSEPVVTKSVTPMRLLKGEIYHVRGWNHKAQFKLESVDGDTATIKTPVRGKTYRVKVADLFYAKKTRLKRNRQARVIDLPTTDRIASKDVVHVPTSEERRIA